MSTSRITTTLLTKLPKYLGRISAVGASGVGFYLAEIFDGMDHTWGSQRNYTAADKIKNAAGAFMLFAPPGYAAGYIGGKGIVKACEVAAKTGIPQAAVSFIKKL